MADASIRAVITAKDEASGVLKGFGNSVSNVARDAGLAIAAAGGALVAFGISSVKAFSESQDLISQTNAVLKSTAGIAGVTAEEVTKLATAWQKQTKFSDEAVRGAENVLLTFTAIGKDKFPQATEAVLNLSTAMHEDLQSASVQVGKALQDPVLGITALRRVGVNFNDAQKDVVKNLVATGHQAEAQSLILQELQREFGGSAVAAGDTFSGSLAKLKNKFNDIQEAIGQTLVKGLTPLAQRLADFTASDKFQAWLKQLTDWLNLNLPLALNWVINTGIPTLKTRFEELWPVVKTAYDIFSDLTKFLIDHQWVFWALVGVFAAIKTAMFLSGALEAFQAVMTGVEVSYGIMAAVVTSPLTMPAIAIGAAVAALFEVRDAAFKTWDAIQNTKNAAEGLAQAQSATRSQLQSLLLSNDPATRNRAANTIAKLKAEGNYATGGFTGQGNSTEIAGIVHKGEYVVPKSQVNQNTGLPNVSGGSVNISVNVGVYAGTQMELRKLATKLQSAYQDAQGMGTA